MCSRRLALRKEERPDVIVEENHNFHPLVHNMEEPVHNLCTQVNNLETPVDDLHAPARKSDCSVDEFFSLHDPCGDEDVVFSCFSVSQNRLLKVASRPLWSTLGCLHLW